MPDRPHERGLLDTSVVIALEGIDPQLLPAEMAISAVTLAELAAGPHATSDPVERGRRQDRLQRAEAGFDAIPFGAEAARAYGRIRIATAASRRREPGRRAFDLLIAATAAAAALPLYTCDLRDFADLGDLAVADQDIVQPVEVAARVQDMRAGDQQVGGPPGRVDEGVGGRAGHQARISSTCVVSAPERGPPPASTS